MSTRHLDGCKTFLVRAATGRTLYFCFAGSPTSTGAASNFMSFSTLVDSSFPFRSYDFRFFHYFQRLARLGFRYFMRLNLTPTSSMRHIAPFLSYPQTLFRPSSASQALAIRLEGGGSRLYSDSPRHLSAAAFHERTKLRFPLCPAIWNLAISLSWFLHRGCWEPVIGGW